jgi:hypothetical protein
MLKAVTHVPSQGVSRRAFDLFENLLGMHARQHFAKCNLRVQAKQFLAAQNLMNDLIHKSQPLTVRVKIDMGYIAP